MKSLVLFLILNCHSVFGQNPCVVDTVYTSKVGYIGVAPFWLQGDNFILFIHQEYGVKSYKKFIFDDSIHQVIQSSSGEQGLRLSQLNEDLGFQNLDISDDIVYTFIGKDFKKYTFDFIIIRKKGETQQFIPFSSTIDNYIDCFDGVSVILKDFIIKCLAYP
jgi:hypothetical protein